MPTPIGHALGGLAVYAVTRDKPLKEDLTFAAVCVGVSLLPDLDLAIGPFAGRSYHHYFSHSLGFAALFGVAVYLVSLAMGRTHPLRDAGVLFAVYLSHIVLDIVGKDTTSPFGVQLFWPLSDAFHISPIHIFDEVRRGTVERLLGLHNWLAVLREIVILAPLLAALWWWRSRFSKRLSSSVSLGS
jgi:membrane-bound metal-dependent hydrolase YbcI (DUF457 family)